MRGEIIGTALGSIQTSPPPFFLSHFLCYQRSNCSEHCKSTLTMAGCLLSLLRYLPYFSLHRDQCIQNSLTSLAVSTIWNTAIELSFRNGGQKERYSSYRILILGISTEGLFLLKYLFPYISGDFTPSLCFISDTKCGWPAY